MSNIKYLIFTFKYIKYSIDPNKLIILNTNINNQCKTINNEYVIREIIGSMMFIT